MANTGPNTNSSQFFITFAPVYVYTYIFFQQKKHAAWQTRVQTPTARSSSSHLRPSRGSTADTQFLPVLRVVQPCVGSFTLLLYYYTPRRSSSPFNFKTKKKNPGIMVVKKMGQVVTDDDDCPKSVSPKLNTNTNTWTLNCSIIIPHIKKITNYLFN